MGHPERILITGAAGFIGAQLAARLLREKRQVIGVDNICVDGSQLRKRRNIASLQTNDRFVFAEVDICEAPQIAEIITRHKPQAIVHLAAKVGVRPSLLQPALYGQVNIQGTIHLLQAAVENAVHKFVFASSSSVYGNHTQVPFHEELPIDAPISPYAATKRAGELLCHTYWHLHQLPITCLRFFTVFGPGQRPDLAIHKFMLMLHARQAIPLFGDGSTSRDYTFIDDILDGICRALERCEGFRIYNLGSRHPVTLLQLLADIEEVVGQRALFAHHPAQAGDVTHTFADIQRAQQELGYQPRHSLREGLQAQWSWMQQQIQEGHLLP